MFILAMLKLSGTFKIYFRVTNPKAFAQIF